MTGTEKPQGLGAYEILRDEILYGDLMPGERLRVADLNGRYKLGLTPIREALMRLASEGLVAAESRRGARVREASLPELRDMMDTRRLIERLCLTRAIALGGADWEAEIVRAFHLLSRAPMPASSDDRDAAAQWESCHRQFHAALVSACGSGWLLRFWNMLADHSERYRKLRLLYRQNPDAAVRNVNAEHEQIVKAVLERDAERAVELMDAHLAQTERAVARLLESQAGATPLEQSQ